MAPRWYIETGTGRECALQYIDHYGDDLLGPFVDVRRRHGDDYGIFISTTDPLDKAIADYLGADIQEWEARCWHMSSAEGRLYLHSLCKKFNDEGFRPHIKRDD